MTDSETTSTTLMQIEQTLEFQPKPKPLTLSLQRSCILFSQTHTFWKIDCKFHISDQAFVSKAAHVRPPCHHQCATPELQGNPSLL